MAGTTLLVVEDEIFIARTIQQGLSNLGYNVPLTFASTQSVFKFLNNKNPQFDLALIDIMLQNDDNDGIYLAQYIKENNNIPTIFITAFSDEKTLSRAKNVRPLGYIVKPFSLLDLHTTIQISLHKNRKDVELLENKHWLAATLNHFKFCLITTDTAFNIKHINHFCEVSTGVKCKIVNNNNIFSVFNFVYEKTDFENLMKEIHINMPLSFDNGLYLNNGKQRKEILLCIIPINEKDNSIGSIWAFTEKKSDGQENSVDSLKELFGFSEIVGAKGLFEKKLDQTKSGIKADKIDESCFEGIIGISLEVKSIVETITQIAPTNSNVLVLGETGTGKELVARAIHKRSLRQEHNFVPVDCVAIPSNLIESELFGFEKGAFTGATARKYGLLEFANNGTIFFDEISELSIDLQAKLLRVLQERQFRRIGGTELIQVNFRVISAMNKNPLKEVVDGRLRKDLYYRINVIPVHIKPLRNRSEDIPLLVNHFLGDVIRNNNLAEKKITPEVISILQNYKWPGNVRQLQNIIERIATLAQNEVITVEDIPDYISLKSVDKSKSQKQYSYRNAKHKSMESFELEYFRKLLKRTNSNISEAATLAGISEKTLYRAIDKYGDLLK